MRIADCGLRISDCEIILPMRAMLASAFAAAALVRGGGVVEERQISAVN
jgi:hypothetical protein